MKKPTLHLICNAHLDPVWKWEWEEGLTETLGTFETAAELLEENPDLIFNHNESVLYEWVLEFRPDLFKRIQKLVAAGRWHIAGGWYLQPDCNMPEGESFVRQILVGRNFFREHFAVEPDLAYNFDAFGHHGNLPQILKKAGYRGYVHFRPDAKSLDLPGDLYQWEGIDGSRVMTYRPPFGWYGTDDHEDLRTRIEDSLQGKTTSTGVVGIFWGMGDHGGGATRQDLRVIQAIQKRQDRVCQSTTAALLADMEAVGAEAPVWKGDLQRVFTGCYTSVAQTKLSNRRSESLVHLAERYATLAWWFLKRPYPADQLERVWKDVLFNQFHDILPGSSTRKAMAGSYEIAGRAMKVAREIALDAQLALMAKTSRRKPLTVVVFNPHPYASTFPVDLEYMVGHRPILTRFVTARVTDARGRNVPCQDEVPAAKATKFDWRKQVVFEAALPALGHAEFTIHLDTRTPGKALPPMLETPPALEWENEHVRFALNPKTGLVQELSRKPDFSDASPKDANRRSVGILPATGKAGGTSTLLKGEAGRLGVFRDGGDAWGTDILRYDKKVGQFRLASPREAAELTGQLHLQGVDPIRVVEKGAVRTVVECLFVYKKSTASIRYIIYQSRPEIEAEVRVIWNQPGLQIKWLWPTHLPDSDYLAEIPYGDITRRQGEGEHVHLRWLALSEPSGDALGIVGIGPSGHEVRKGEVRITLLRSAIYCHGSMHSLRERVFHDFMDLGESRFRFALLPTRHENVRADIARLSERLSLPPTALVHFPLGASQAKGVDSGKPLISVDGEGLELGAIKRSENGRDLILRIVERAGRPATGQLKLANRPTPHALAFQPYEIKTLRIASSGAIRECDLLERKF